MDQTLKLTEGELYEVSDAVNAALRDYLDRGDPEHHEAVFGSVSNLLAAAKKITGMLLPGTSPGWLAEFERRVRSLRAAEETSPAARDTVARSPHRDESPASQDGIRVFRIKGPAP